MAARRVEWSFLGRMPYADAVRLQERVRDELRRGAGPERLLLLEHPPVYTLGRNADAGDVTADAAWIAGRGIEVHASDRGGQATYHGPGQLVGYPILDLSPDRRDVARYLRDLEEVLIRTLSQFGVTAGRVSGLTGVWVGPEKIASLGVHLSRWVTTHGFALNVNTDLSRFGLIVPCGLRGAAVTSMQRLLGRPLPLEEVAAAIVPVFGEVFGRDMAPGSPPVAPAAAPALTEVA